MNGLRRCGRLRIQDGGVKGRALISSCESTKITTSCWTTIDRRTLEPTKKDTPHPETKKLQWDGRQGRITIKSNPIPAGWVPHKLENNNTKEVLPLLWRFWITCQASQPGDSTNGLGILRESDLEGLWDLMIGLPQDWGKQETPILEDTNKILCVPRPRVKGQWPQRRLNQTYRLMLEDPLWKCGSAVAHHGNGTLAAAVLEGAPLHKSFWRVPLTLP